MMRNKTSSSMQKTYDEVYLTCSTAVYFEGKNNEAEALRSWRSALDQIYYHNAYGVSPTYRPKSDQEKALQESIRTLELRCKERVDLLETLKKSRVEAKGTEETTGEGVKPQPGRSLPPTPTEETRRHSYGWIGEGTIPAVQYPELSTPGPPLPDRPTFSKIKSADSSIRTPSPSFTESASASTSASPLPSNLASRTSSPEKRARLRTTLRPTKESKGGKRPSFSNALSKQPPVASKAAGLAWDSTTRNSFTQSLPGQRASVLPYNSFNPNATASLPLRPRSPLHQGSIASTPSLASQASAAALLPSRQRSPPRKPRVPPTHPISRQPVANISSPRTSRQDGKTKGPIVSSVSADENMSNRELQAKTQNPKMRNKRADTTSDDEPTTPLSSGQASPEEPSESAAWEERVAYIKKHLPKGVDENAARQIFNEIVVQGDEVHWEDIAGLDAAKNALKEAVVYPFLRPDLFMGLREPARGMLLFGPPGTGKTMLARAVATESRSTFFAISASSLTSKWLGESEKLVRALFTLAKALAPSIIFVDEIDALLSSRGGSSEHESSRRIKTEFLIQWSDLQRAAAGREQTDKQKKEGDASRVLVLAATNMPWAIDEAARRRFVRRQYIPLPEARVRAEQLVTLLGHQKHNLSQQDIDVLVDLTDGYSGSDITALAKDAAMGPLRSLGEALLHMSMDQIRSISFEDFEASLASIRPSVSKRGLQEFEDWAKEFGERGG